MLRESDVIDICNSWLAEVMFDWRHVMVTLVECNNQTRWIITFLRRLFARFKSKFLQKMNKNNVNSKCKYRRWISVFWGSSKYECNGSLAKLTLLCMWPVEFKLRWTSEKWNLFLKYYFQCPDMERVLVQGEMFSWQYLTPRAYKAACAWLLQGCDPKCLIVERSSPEAIGLR